MLYDVNHFLRIGDAGAGLKMKGFDDVRIWNVARSQAQIQANMNCTLTGHEAGLVTIGALMKESGVRCTTSPLGRPMACSDR